MPKYSIAQQFKKFVAGIHAKRRELEQLEQELAQMTAALGGAGIAAIRKGRPDPKAVVTPKSGKKAGRRRKRFDMTAEQFILKIVGAAKQLTTAQINEQWKQGKRAGIANNALGKLVKEKKLVRVENKKGRGSVYKVAGA